MERRQDVSVIHLLHVLLERCNDVLKGRNIDIQSLHPHDVSKKSQMKHPMTSQWYVSTTSLRLVRLYDVSCNSQIKQPKTLLWYVSTTPWSYVFATSCQQFSTTYSNYFVKTSIWQVSRSHFKSNTKFFQYQPGGKQKEQFGL